MKFKKIYALAILLSVSVIANSGVVNNGEEWRQAIERNDALRRSVMQNLNAVNSGQCAAYLIPAVAAETYGVKLTEEVVNSLGLLWAATSYYRSQMLKSGVQEKSIDKIWKPYLSELNTYGSQIYIKKYGVMCSDLAGIILENAKQK